MRQARGHPHEPLAAQAEAQLRHAPARARRGPALGAVDAGARGHFDDSDLHARGRGAPEADLQGAPPARVRPNHRGVRQPAISKSARAVAPRSSTGSPQAPRRLPRPQLCKTDKRMPDYMYMLESRLSAEQRAAMMRVQELAAETGLKPLSDGRCRARPGFRHVHPRPRLHGRGQSLSAGARNRKGRRARSSARTRSSARWR